MMQNNITYKSYSFNIDSLLLTLLSSEQIWNDVFETLKYTKTELAWCKYITLHSGIKSLTKVISITNPSLRVQRLYTAKSQTYLIQYITIITEVIFNIYRFNSQLQKTELNLFKILFNSIEYLLKINVLSISENEEIIKRIFKKWLTLSSSETIPWYLTMKDYPFILNYLIELFINSVKILKSYNLLSTIIEYLTAISKESKHILSIFSSNEIFLSLLTLCNINIDLTKHNLETNQIIQFISMIYSSTFTQYHMKYYIDKIKSNLICLSNPVEIDYCSDWIQCKNQWYLLQSIFDKQDHKNKNSYNIEEGFVFNDTRSNGIRVEGIILIDKKKKNRDTFTIVFSFQSSKNNITQPLLSFYTNQNIFSLFISRDNKWTAQIWWTKIVVYPYLIKTDEIYLVSITYNIKSYFSRNELIFRVNSNSISHRCNIGIPDHYKINSLLIGYNIDIDKDQKNFVGIIGNLVIYNDNWNDLFFVNWFENKKSKYYLPQNTIKPIYNIKASTVLNSFKCQESYTVISSWTSLKLLFKIPPTPYNLSTYPFITSDIMERFIYYDGIHYLQLVVEYYYTLWRTLQSNVCLEFIYHGLEYLLWIVSRWIHYNEEDCECIFFSLCKLINLICFSNATLSHTVTLGWLGILENWNILANKKGRYYLLLNKLIIFLLCVDLYDRSNWIILNKMMDVMFIVFDMSKKLSCGNLFLFRKLLNFSFILEEEETLNIDYLNINMNNGSCMNTKLIEAYKRLLILIIGKFNQNEWYNVLFSLQTYITDLSFLYFIYCWLYTSFKCPIKYNEKLKTKLSSTLKKLNSELLNNKKNKATSCQKLQKINAIIISFILTNGIEDNIFEDIIIPNIHTDFISVSLFKSIIIHLYTNISKKQELKFITAIESDQSLNEVDVILNNFQLLPFTKKVKQLLINYVDYIRNNTSVYEQTSNWLFNYFHNVIYFFNSSDGNKVWDFMYKDLFLYWFQSNRICTSLFYFSFSYSSSDDYTDKIMQNLLYLLSNLIKNHPKSFLFTFITKCFPEKKFMHVINELWQRICDEFEQYIDANDYMINNNIYLNIVNFMSSIDIISFVNKGYADHFIIEKFLKNVIKSNLIHSRIIEHTGKTIVEMIIDVVWKSGNEKLYAWLLNSDCKGNNSILYRIDSNINTNSKIEEIITGTRGSKNIVKDCRSFCWLFLIKWFKGEFIVNTAIISLIVSEAIDICHKYYKKFMKNIQDIEHTEIMNWITTLIQNGNLTNEIVLIEIQNVFKSKKLIGNHQEKNEFKDSFQISDEVDPVDKPMTTSEQFDLCIIDVFDRIETFFDLNINNSIICLKRDLLLKKLSIYFEDIYFSNTSFKHLAYKYDSFLRKNTNSHNITIYNFEYSSTYPVTIRNFSNPEYYTAPIFVKHDLHFFNSTTFNITHPYYKFKVETKFPKSFHSIVNSTEKTYYIIIIKVELISKKYNIVGKLGVSSSYIEFNSINCSDIYNDIDYAFHSCSSDIVNREKQIIIKFNDIYEILVRTFLFMEQGIEVFLKNGKSYFFNLFSSDKLNSFLPIIEEISPKTKIIKKLKEEFIKKKYTKSWWNRSIDNFQYLLYLNKYSNRSYNSLYQYPIIPWIVLSRLEPNQLSRKNIMNTTASSSSNKDNCFKIKLRQFQYAISIQLQKNKMDIYNKSKQFFIENKKIRHFNLHYSTMSYVVFYLSRMNPFTINQVKLQSKMLDNPNRQIMSFEENLQTLFSCYDNRELIPELYTCDIFFYNINKVLFGIRSNDNLLVNNIVVSPNPHEYVYNLRKLLNSKIIMKDIHAWINNIFGIYSYTTDIKRLNTFDKYSYSQCINLQMKRGNMIKNGIDKAKILRKIETMISSILSFGQNPSQLFDKEHIKWERLEKPSEEKQDEFDYWNYIQRSSTENILSSCEVIDIGFCINNNNIYLLCKEFRSSHQVIGSKNCFIKIYSEFLKFESQILINKIKLFRKEKIGNEKSNDMSIPNDKSGCSNKRNKSFNTERSQGGFWINPKNIMINVKQYFIVGRNKDNTLKVYSQHTMSLIKEIQNFSFVSCLYLMPNSWTAFISGHRDGLIIFWSISFCSSVSISFIQERKIFSHFNSMITCIEYNIRHNILIAGALNGNIHIRKYYDLEWIHIITFKSHTNSIFSTELFVSSYDIIYALIFDKDMNKYKIISYNINCIALTETIYSNFTNIVIWENGKVWVGVSNKGEILLLDGANLSCEYKNCPEILYNQSVSTNKEMVLFLYKIKALYCVYNNGEIIRIREDKWNTMIETNKYNNVSLFN